MADGVHVRSVEALEGFETCLGRAQDDTQEFLASARAQVSTILDWITDQEHAAQRTISQAEDHLNSAQDNLTEALNAPYDDDEDPPDCSAEEAEVSEAEGELQSAIDRSEEVRRIAEEVRTTAEDFLDSARQLDEISGERLRMAQLYVRAKVVELSSYIA